jgi:ankyrin repeat protein
MRIQLFSQQNSVVLLCTFFLNMHAMELQLRTEGADVGNVLPQNNDDLDARDKYGETRLFNAVRSKNLLLVEQLIACKSNLNIQNKSGRTPLLLAVFVGKPDVVKMLLEGDADPNIKDRDEETPIFDAVRIEHQKIVTLLVESKAHLNIQDNDGYAPLHRAVFVGNPDVVTVLLEGGADPDIRDKHCGKTSLHEAVLSNDKAVVEVLLKKGAYVNITDKSGATALRLSIELKSYPLTLLLARSFYTESLSSLKKQAMILLCMRKYFNKTSVLKTIDKRIFSNCIFPYLWDNPLSNSTELTLLQQRVEREKKEGKTEKNSQ